MNKIFISLMKTITEKRWERRSISISQYSTTLVRHCLLSQEEAMVSLCRFTIVIGTAVAVASVSITSVFLISNGVVKMLLKTKGKRNNKHRNIVLLARSKLNK